MQDTLTLDHFTPEDVTALRKIMLQLLRNDELVGSWSHKTNVRQTGCSINVTYAHKVDVRLDGKGVSDQFTAIMLQAPDQLWALLVKLFAVGDGEDMAALKAEALA